MKTVLPFRIWTNCQFTILNLHHPLSRTNHSHQVINHHQQEAVEVAWDSNQATVTSHQLLATYLEQVLMLLVSCHLISSVQHQWHNNKITIRVWCRANPLFTIHLKIKTIILLQVVVCLSLSLKINKMLICTFHPMTLHLQAIITPWILQPRQMVWVTWVGAVQTVASLTWAIIWIMIIRSGITIISINKLIIQSMILKPGLRP